MSLAAVSLYDYINIYTPSANVLLIYAEFTRGCLNIYPGLMNAAE